MARTKPSAECPFCGREIARPRGHEVDAGPDVIDRCGCGVVYVYDRTGRNVGQAYLEALVKAIGKGWEADIMAEEHAHETADYDYDHWTHRRVYGRGSGTHTGKLVFIRMLSQGPAQGAQKMEERMQKPVIAKRTSKQEIRGLLESKLFDDIGRAALQDRGVIRYLLSLSYDKQDVITWRVIEAMGFVARALLPGNAALVRETVRKLLWTMTEESGGTAWSAPEMIGEIVRSDPEEFSDIIPILWSSREEALFTAGSLWAMGRIAMVRPDLVRFVLPDLPPFLQDPDPQVRGLAVRVFDMLADRAALTALEPLRNDPASFRIYLDGELAEVSVAELAASAFDKWRK